jgi:hypothetical protein
MSCFVTLRNAYLRHYNILTTMTRKQINQLLATHEAHRSRALHHLRQILEYGEAYGQEVRWSRLLIIHTAMIALLRAQKPDDD